MIAHLCHVAPWDLEERATLEHFYRLRSFVDSYNAAAAAAATTE